MASKTASPASSAPTTPSPTATSSKPLFVGFETPALTTTFIPPPDCRNRHLTMLQTDDNQIWMNAPRPVRDITVSSCYPPEFMASFLKSADNTLLPAFSPLVCPDFYKTIYSSTLSESSVYVACCPDGYSLAPPSTPIPGGRYAYGGTCYSDISSVSVTKYDDKKLNGVDLFTTSASTQAYAYPIDGYALSPTIDSSATQSTFISRTMDAASTQSTLSIPTFYVANPSNYTTLSNGAIAGIAVGCIAFVAIIAAAICFTCLRKRRPRRPQAVEKGTGSGSGVPMWKKFSHGIHSAVEAPTSYNRSQDRSQRRSHNDPLDSGKKELPVAPKHPAVRHNKNRVAEVPGESRRYELPANDGLVPGGRSGLGNTTTVSAEPAAIVRAMRNAWNQSPTSPVPPLERTH